jgi:electron transport complex protein RnfG
MSATAPPTASPASAQRMIAVLGIVALVSGLLVVSAYELALPSIEENKRIAVARAIAAIYPSAKTRRAYLVTSERLAPSSEAAAQGQVAYAVFDSDGKFLGVAAEAAARGYQDVVRLLYAYSPDCQCITGMHVLRNNDTPGIGDKIAKDRPFLENFRALDARLAPDGRTLAHPIVTVKHGTKLEAWQIDAISGATITSKAVGRALNESAQTVVPRVAAQLQAITQPEIKP